MTALWLVRHGSTEWTGHRYCGVSDPPLDAAGERAAAALASRLAGEPMTDVRIVSSPRLRARATAAAIAAAMDADTVDLDERWGEVDMGAAEGRTFSELERLDPSLAARLVGGAVSVDWPGGETSIAFERRVAQALDASRDLGRPTVIVSHAGPIRSVVARVRGVDLATVVFLEPGEATRLEI